MVKVLTPRLSGRCFARLDRMIGTLSHDWLLTCYPRALIVSFAGPGRWPHFASAVIEMQSSRYNMSATVIMRRLCVMTQCDGSEYEITLQNRLLGEANQSSPSAGLSLNSSIVHNYDATSAFGLGSAFIPDPGCVATPIFTDGTHLLGLLRYLLQSGEEHNLRGTATGIDDRAGFCMLRQPLLYHRVRLVLLSPSPPCLFCFRVAVALLLLRYLYGRQLCPTSRVHHW